MKNRVFWKIAQFIIITLLSINFGLWLVIHESKAQESTPVPYPLETVEVEKENQTAATDEAYPIKAINNSFLEDGAENTTAVLIGAFILVLIISLVSGTRLLHKPKDSIDLSIDKPA